MLYILYHLLIHNLFCLQEAASVLTSVVLKHGLSNGDRDSLAAKVSRTTFINGQNEKKVCRKSQTYR
jgi:hypothetical protein